MKFDISSDSLKERLLVVSRVIDSNPILPILEDFLFRVKENSLEIVATDLETFMTSEVEITPSGSTGSVAIPGKILIDTLKQLPTQPITFDIDLETFSITITSTFGQYQLAGEDGSDFPKLPVPESVDTVQILSVLLLQGIRKTLFAISNDDLRPAMTGVFVQLNSRGITLVSTDAHKLVKYTFHKVSTEAEASFIIPKKALAVLEKALAKDDTVEISFNQSNAFFYFKSQIVVCRLIDARYPDYDTVIPSVKGSVMTIAREDLLKSLRRLSYYTNQNTNQVKWSIKDGSVTIEAENLDFSNKAKERIPCNYDGEEMLVGFNAKFLVEMLHVMDGANVRIELTEPNRASILRSEEMPENEDLLMLIMPLRIDA